MAARPLNSMKDTIARKGILFLAQGAGDKLHKVEPFGMPFEHPAGDVEGLLCSDCYNGANQ